MPVTSTAVFVQTPKITPITIVNGTGTGTVTAFTAGSNGAKVVAVLANSNDTVARIVTLSLTRSATAYTIGSYSVPAVSGTDGVTAGVDLLNGGPATLIPGLPVDNDGQKYIFMESGDTLTVAATTTITSGKTITFITVAGNF